MICSAMKGHFRLHSVVCWWCLKGIGLIEIIDIKWKIPHLENKGSVIHSAERPLTPLARKAIEMIAELLIELKNEENISL